MSIGSVRRKQFSATESPPTRFRRSLQKYPAPPNPRIAFTSLLSSRHKFREALREMTLSRG